MDLETLIGNAPYAIEQAQKEHILTQHLNNLTLFHFQHCPEYANIIRLLYHNNTKFPSLDAIPFLPVNIFKEIHLASISNNEIFKTLTSSGTTGSIPSVISLDSSTSRLQTTALATIMQSYLGTKRLPMLIIDSSHILKDPKNYSARGAAILGMSSFGRDHFYALDEHLQLKRSALKDWLKKHHGKEIFIFGFTYILWQHLLKKTNTGEFDFSNAILFHGGGWKKLNEASIKNNVFKAELKNHFNIQRCHSFYGMVEQTGSVFVECEEGHLHCPTFADIIVRNPSSWKQAQQGEVGVVQTLSVLPKSYPGHSLLTDDLGYIKGIDTCPCGRKGKFFWIEGRVPQAEPRGCGDTLAMSIDPLKPHENTQNNLPKIFQGEYLYPSSKCEHSPFDPLLHDFCEQLSKNLLKHNDPDLAALGFWLRPAQLNVLKERFASLNKGSLMRVPRGVVFHITASNVDTLFAYSWVVSLLTGNNNIVRVPSKHSAAIEQILEIIQNLFKIKAFESIYRGNTFIRYGHQDDITKNLSLMADVRIIWGSNETIQNIRTIPLNPYAKELVFPDRTSYAAICAQRYTSLTEEQQEGLAKAFFRDAYGFDQHGCSSPQIIFWIGNNQESTKASELFYHFLKQEIRRRGYRVPLSEFLRKQTAIYSLCAQYPIALVESESNEITILHEHEPLQKFHHPGAGLFFHIDLSKLDDIISYISPRDQTLTYFGFDTIQIDKLMAQLKEKGPSRLVPIGEGLNFSSIWDGYDLLQELTRCIEIHPPHTQDI